MSNRTASYKTDLARARGLGSAKEGTHHWWSQRVSAVALIPLSLWFAASFVFLTGSDYETVIEWLRDPRVSVLWLAYLIALFYHANLGMQVVVEDYVSNEGRKIMLLVACKLTFTLLGIACVYALLRIGFGG